MKPIKLSYVSKLLTALLVFFVPSMIRARGQTIIPIANPGFNSGGGQIDSDLTLVRGSSTIGPQQIGTSGWYGIARHTNLVAGVPLAGFRPGLEVDNDSSSNDVAEIRYNIGASLGGLAGLEMPEVDLWQPLTGQTLLPNRTYTFSIEYDAGAVLNISALTNRGFGIGVTTGATATSMGTFVADSLSSPSLVTVDLLSGSRQRLSLTFATGASPAAGTLGIAIFAGRGVQQLQLSLLSDIDIDNAALKTTLTTVPEPNAAILVGLGIGVILGGRRLRKTLSGSRKD